MSGRIEARVDADAAGAGKLREERDELPLAAADFDGRLTAARQLEAQGLDTKVVRGEAGGPLPGTR